MIPTNTIRRILLVAGMLLSFSVLLAGAKPVAATCDSSGSPTVSTDKADYGPFETALISGTGFQCGETISVLVTAPDGSTLSADGTGSAGPDVVTADENGTFTLNYALSGTFENGDLYHGQEGEYQVTVTGATGAVLASTTFTDGQGDFHSCALTTSGGVKCWGYNYYGQLGIGTYTTGLPGGEATPRDVYGLSSGVDQLSGGTFHTCALLSTGVVKCWGYNRYGQVGNGSFTPRVLTPADVSGLSGVLQVSAGAFHSCALTQSGGVKCWGRNNQGQLGTNTYGNVSATPQYVSGLTSGVVQVSAGAYHTCALLSTGAVKCWGWNYNGQLGIGTFITRVLTPTDVSGLSSGVDQISSGLHHTCALLSSGGVRCWGLNFHGQVGNGSFTTRINTPASVSGLSSGVDQISAAGFHTCAVTTGSGAKCWGRNNFGQLGTGSFSPSSVATPADVSGLNSGVAQISGGGFHTCALLSSGGVRCWGSSRYGQVGNGTYTTSSPYGFSLPQGVSGLSSGVASLPDIAQTVTINRLPAIGPSGDVIVDEGQTAANTGTVSDPDGDTVALTASVGSVTNNNDGTWSWSLATTDGPADSQTVTITADDNQSGSVQTTFQLTVNNVAPSVTVAGPTTVDEGGSESYTATILDPGSSDTHTVVWDCDGDGYDDGSGLTATCSFSDGPAMFAVAAQATDDDGGVGAGSVDVTVNNVAPTAVFNAPTAVDEGSDIGLALTSPFDPSSADTTAGFEYAFDCGDGSGYGAFSSTTTATCATADDGTRAVRGQIRDKDGGVTEYTANVTINNVAPAITGLSLDAATIDENESVTLGGNFSDPGTLDTHTVVIDWGDGSSNTTINLTGGERAFSASHHYLDDNPPGTASDNYTISVTVSDDDGGLGSGSSSVTVNNVPPTIDSLTGPTEPVDIGDQSAVSVVVAFGDPGTLDTHDVTWSWGDSSSDTQHGATSPATQSHAYSAPGVYEVTVTVTDDDGGTVSQDYEYIVIYDPDGGFVTGGGWIDSPAGAYVADPLLTGRANFGFVSKYKKGATVPTGQTEFQFKAGDLNFHSSSYEWLVVAGHDKAKYKGVGTINGTGNYGFMLTVTDNENSPDTFRIKIWDIDNGDAIVYDNQMGVDDDAYDGTEIGGGNIKVHNQ